MSKSNGLNPNSLFALENSLFGSPPKKYSVEQSSAEEEMGEDEDDENETAQTSESRTVEAQSFDWDETIDLAYEQDAEPDSDSMSWQRSEGEAESLARQDRDDLSQDFDWDEEELSANDGQAFEGEAAGMADLEDPLSHSNSLFALEQSVFKADSLPSPSFQFAIEDDEPKQQPIESQAFDWNEAIELECEASTHPTPESIEPTSESFTWLPTKDYDYGFELDKEPLTYEVEAFEVVDEPESDSEDASDSEAYGFDAENEQLKPEQLEDHPAQESNYSPVDEAHAHASALNESEAFDAWTDTAIRESYGFDADTSNSPTQAFDRDNHRNQDKPDHPRTQATSNTAVPVQAIVANPPNPPNKSAEPTEAFDFDFDEFDRAPIPDQAADAAAFAADIEAILRGEKVYEPPSESSSLAPAPQSSPPSSVRSQSPASPTQSVPPKQPSGHDIFDQMSMSHAIAFDLGTFSLEQTFDEFDEILDEEESTAFASEEEEATNRQPQDNEASATAQPFAFDEEEFAADVAAFGADEPWQTVQFQLGDADITALINNNSPNENELKSQYFQRLQQEAQKSFQQRYVPKLDDEKIRTAINQLWANASLAESFGGFASEKDIPFVLGEEQLAQVAEVIVKVSLKQNEPGSAVSLTQKFRQVMNWDSKNLGGKIGMVYQAAFYWLGVAKTVFPGDCFFEKTVDPKSVKRSVKSENLPRYNGQDSLAFFQYPDLYALIKQNVLTPNGMNDQVLANAVRDCVAGKRVQNEFVHLIYLVMFGAETLRCPRWYGISMMILDLISAGKITWENVFGARQTGQHYYPPSTINAVAFSKAPDKPTDTIREENAVIDAWLRLVTPATVNRLSSQWVIDQIKTRFSSQAAMIKPPTSTNKTNAPNFTDDQEFPSLGQSIGESYDMDDAIAQAMSKNWTGQQRYDNSLDYLRSVSQELADHVDNTLVGDRNQIGMELSLAGETKYAIFGDKPVGRAVRALLLCHRAYLSKNWAKSTGNRGKGVPTNYTSANGDTLTKDKYLNTSEAVVREAIKAYIALTPLISDVANAAILVGNGTSPASPPYETLTRQSTVFPSGQVCFNCVYWWLFKSGFVSLRWILRNGFKLGAENANLLLGDGISLTRGDDGTVPPIPRGMVINWRGNQEDTKGICHWAVSLGDGTAIGANNSPGGRLNGADIITTFHTGNSAFGIFNVSQMWDIYMGDKTMSNTTQKSGCIVAIIDPNTIPNRDTGEEP